MNLTESAINKGLIGGTGAITVITPPSNYISFFDKIYDVGIIVISGDDIARILAAIVSLIVATNIIYGVSKDIISRNKKTSDHKDDKSQPEEKKIITEIQKIRSDK